MGKNQVSRRNFLKGAGVLTGAAAIAAISGCSPNAKENTTTSVDAAAIAWDYECDILVCGGGGGLLAACDAADAGNEVILIEKANVIGGESSVNEAWINGSGTSVQRAEGVEDSGEIQAIDYAINHEAHMNNVDEELLADYCANSGASIERLIELGAEYILDQDTMFYTTAPRAHMMQPDASAWSAVLGAACQERGVDIMTGTPLTGLITDETGQIVGARSGDKAFKARKGVILATGDISGNERMKHKFQPEWSHIEAAIPSNTGDGLFAALLVGADTSFTQFTGVGPALTYDPTGSVVAYYQTLKGLIVVNQEGKRFANEDDIATLAGTQYDQTDGNAYMIFDSRIASISMRPDCHVSEINERLFAGESVEIGLISGIGPSYLDDFMNDPLYDEALIAVDTIEEIASHFGIDSSNLTEQIASWNDAIASRTDEEFGRDLSGALQFGDPVGIEEAPFYAFKMKSPKWICTEGPNLMVNTDMSVLDVEGEPISRLFACGAGIMAGTATLYANSCGDHMGITAYSARRSAERLSALDQWDA